MKLYDSLPILKKLLYEKIPIIFIMKGIDNNRIKWFDFIIDEYIFQCSKGHYPLDPIYISLQYQPSTKHGGGHQLQTEFELDSFKLENNEKFEKFIFYLKRQAQTVVNKGAKLFPNIQNYSKNKTLEHFIINQKIIRFDDWSSNIPNFIDFAKNFIGYKIDDDLFYHFYENVPPIIGEHWFCNSEPYDSKLIKGKFESIYVSFHKFQNEWYYSGLKTIPEMEEWNLFVKDLYGKIERESE
jgi:hypothetical protein